EQFRTYNRERCKEPPLIAGDSNSKRGKKQCSSEQALATHKRWARRKRNAQEPEVTIPSRLSLKVT
ncbi:unnamed protein product, partial [Hymenolepis diminuta]